MASRSVNQARAAGRQTAVLNALAGGDCLTLDALCDRLGSIERRSLIAAAGALVERGLVERIERGCFRLTAEGAQAQAAGLVIKSGPRRGFLRRRPARNTLNTRLWRAMRLMRKFTVPALLELAARDEKNPTHGAGRFIRALERAGYLLRLPGRAPGTSPNSNGFVRWSLVRDTGDLPPMPRRDGAVFDPNIGQVVGADHQSEVTPCNG